MGKSDSNSDRQQCSFGYMVARVRYKHRQSNEMTQPRCSTMVSDEQVRSILSYWETIVEQHSQATSLLCLITFKLFQMLLCSHSAGTGSTNIVTIYTVYTHAHVVDLYTSLGYYSRVVFTVLIECAHWYIQLLFEGGI